jgi:two-component system OmpR family response regulator
MKMGKKALFIKSTAAYPELAGLLGEVGFETDITEDVGTGLIRLELESYDIAVVTESHSPESWQLCQSIKSRAAVPLIVINAGVSPEAAARAIYAGADFFMRKSFGPREFLARVNCLLQRPSPRQAVTVA